MNAAQFLNQFRPRPLQFGLAYFGIAKRVRYKARSRSVISPVLPSNR